MHRRRLIALALIVLAVAVFAIWQGRTQREPKFEGRPLSYWLAQLDGRDGKFFQAQHALRTIGTNAIPTLLEMVDAKEMPALAKRAVNSVGIETRSAEVSQEIAGRVFQLLSTNAAPAVPGLTDILKNSRDPSARICALTCLGHIGSAARPAMPVVVQGVNDTNYVFSQGAFWAISQIGGEPRVVVPALIAALTNSTAETRWSALFTLRGYGPRARSAVPAILRLTNDAAIVGRAIASDGTIVDAPQSITYLVGDALWHIAPEKTPKAFVVETSSPIITNQQTTFALKAELQGKREVLIPAHSIVPAVATRDWREPQRPTLRLYHGDNETDAHDVFFGEFEILCVPDARPNITTACVIADGQIFLCARDNSRFQSVDIRRQN